MPPPARATSTRCSRCSIRTSCSAPTRRPRNGRPPVIDGRAGLTWAPGGEPRVVFTFTFTFAIADGRITRIELLADPEHLAQTELELL
ncbi:MAG TPA: hypothetical protein VJX66_26900 [Amycolatopsis sp.]|nr:hypothetical protein [Amycolatopsis sp.]